MRLDMNDGVCELVPDTSDEERIIVELSATSSKVTIIKASCLPTTDSLFLAPGQNMVSSN